MPKIPDDLRVCFTGSVADCLCAGKIELMRLRFNQMPAQSLARRVYTVTLEEPEVAGCELVVFRGPHKIESFTLAQMVSRAFESAKKETLKRAHLALFSSATAQTSSSNALK